MGLISSLDPNGGWPAIFNRFQRPPWAGMEGTPMALLDPLIAGFRTTLRVTRAELAWILRGWFEKSLNRFRFTLGASWDYRRNRANGRLAAILG